MTTVEEVEKLEELYKQAQYRRIIDLVEDEILRLGSLVDDKKILLKSWAHHQLGEYDKSIALFGGLSQRNPADTEIGESARRGLAHGLLQNNNNVEAADRIMQEILPSPARNNVRMNIFLAAARKGLEIPVETAVEIARDTLESDEVSTTDMGHILNNCALLLYETRERETTKPHLNYMPIFIFAAIGVYKGLDAPANHIAGARFRASKICEAVGQLDLARSEAEKSVKLWQGLVNSQDGERYRQNLEGAEAQLKKLSP